ncbi:GL25203 [Drosophila persimilis]|uniref:GL25203 n=1 Tax=Drosophila persimilis TaxID=7234 RepID=B4GRH4_DROPE|nr:GL25203 [Drosophila persimilis]
MHQQLHPQVQQPQQENMGMVPGSPGQAPRAHQPQEQQTLPMGNHHLFNGAPYLRPHTTALRGFSRGYDAAAPYYEQCPVQQYAAAAAAAAAQPAEQQHTQFQRHTYAYHPYYGKFERSYGPPAPGSSSGTAAASVLGSSSSNSNSNSIGNTNINAFNFGSNYPMNFSARLGEYSPRDEYSSGSSSSSSSPQLQRNEAAMFKPLFKKYTN